MRSPTSPRAQVVPVLRTSPAGSEEQPAAAAEDAASAAEYLERHPDFAARRAADADDAEDAELGRLWLGLVQFYGHTFNYAETVVSVRSSQRLLRSEKGSPSLCVLCLFVSFSEAKPSTLIVIYSDNVLSFVARSETCLPSMTDRLPKRLPTTGMILELDH